MSRKRRSLQRRTLTGNWIAESPSGSVVWRVVDQEARPVVVTLDRTVTLSAASAELRRFAVDLERLALGEKPTTKPSPGEGKGGRSERSPS